MLRYYTDLSEQATADVLGISVGAVKSAGSRGLATLRAALTASHAADAADADEDAAAQAQPTPERTGRERSAR
ncbi:hypothetical protein GCM10009817_03450 [Terrabacter lapilli]|uniref:RNA polymerase sigma factor 70 region 4 type 2 domain-containing protein n=1 Tax=Terrabacter lapilli TaxID=436231 RepID=A0ABN2RCF4_9MICO